MYKIIRFYDDGRPNKTMRTGLSLKEAQEHCTNPETSSQTCSDFARKFSGVPDGVQWFDGYTEIGRIYHKSFAEDLLDSLTR